MGAAPQPLVRTAAPAFRGGTPALQRAALTVSGPQDSAEREARDAAQKVVRMPAAVTAGPASPVLARSLQRVQRAEAGGGGVDAATSARIQARRGGGQPLAAPLRRFMEPRFGADFSAVRLHTDGEAAVLSQRVSARAFTVGGDVFFGPGQYQPESDSGRELIAHELAHTVQQGASPRATRVQRSVADELSPQPAAAVQRDLIPDSVLDRLAALAANVPGYTLLTVIIGRNPINQRTVERTAVNLLRGFIGLIPGGEALFEVLQRQGIVDRIGQWISAQVATLGLSYERVRDTFLRFVETLGFSDVLNPGGVWARAEALFTPIVTRIRSFVGGLVTQAITWLKATFMEPLAGFCRQIPGYGLVTVMLGRDPFTDAPVPRTALTVVRAFAEFIPGGTEKVNQLVESGALERAYAWFQQETTARNLTWARVTGTFATAWNSLRLEDVLHPLDTLQRMVNLFRPLLSDLVGFAGAALLKLLELIYEAAMGAGGRRILAILTRARATFVVIINDPVAFLRNLLSAVGQGIRQFMTRILVHLRDGVIRWLTGPVAAAGVQMPERWDLAGIVGFVLQILGLTWARVRGKLVNLMGERVVAGLEAGFQLLLDIRERGLVAALRDRVTEFFGNLREAALGAIRGFIQQRLVTAGITQLLSMLNPVGAVIQAIIKTYTTIQFFIQRINQILDLVESIVDSIARIASGAIGAAADFVERTMARTIPVILDFLARFIGLGDVAGQVTETIRGIQARVDSMLDRAVEWIRNQARNLASRALGGDPNATPEQRVRAGVAEAKQVLQRFGGQRVGALVMRPLLAAIRLRHRLNELDVVARGERWAVRAVVNPIFEDGTNVLVVPDGAATDWPTGSAVDPIPIKWFKPRDGFYPTMRVRGGPERTPRQGITLPAVGRRPAQTLRVAGGNFMAMDQKIGRQARGNESTKDRIRAHIVALRDEGSNSPVYVTFDGASGFAIDHVRDLTWRGTDDEENLWPLATDKNNAINASHNQVVRFRDADGSVKEAAVMNVPGAVSKWFRIKKIATTAPSSSGDHGSTRDHPINSGLGDIPKRAP